MRSKASEVNVESFHRIKDRNRSLTLGEVEVQRMWKEYFENLYYIDIQEQVEFHICGFDGVRRGNVFGGKVIRRTEVEVGVGKLKNGKAVGKDEVTEEVIKGGGEKGVDWIWKLCNMAFESGAVPEDWKSAMEISYE